MAEAFKIGDIVKLKSDGPRMTVTGVDNIIFGGTRQVHTAWFTGRKKESASFPCDALELVAEEAKTKTHSIRKSSRTRRR